MNNNDYERLKKQGYTEEEINVSLDEIGRMQTYDRPMGPGREDRGVNVRDNAGLERKTSSIMMGYNKQGIILENGDYVSWVEAEQALKETLAVDEENYKYVSKKSGKVVEPPEIIDEIMKKTVGQTHLSLEPTDKITNQQAMRMTVHQDGKEYPKGIAMLGNQNIQLPSGIYVSRNEIELAINEYVGLRGPKEVVPQPTPSPTPIPVPPPSPTPTPTPPEDIEPIKEEPENKQTKDEESYKVIKRIFRKMSWIPLAVGILAEVMAGFGHTDVINDVEVLKRLNNLGYSVTTVDETQNIYETPEDVAERLYEDIILGEDVYIDEGISYYESSDHEYGGSDKMGVFGQGERDAGEYDIDGFSIIKDGEIIATEWDKNIDLYSVIEKVAKETNTPIEDLVPVIHVGGPVAGWVDVCDLFAEPEKEPQLKDRKVILDEENTYEGEIKDFSGDTIVINNGEEDVTLNIRNEDGSLKSNGDIVVGSDGQEYHLDNISLEEEEVIDIEHEKVGTKLNWSVTNITLQETLAIAGATAALMYLSSKIKQKEMTTMTGSQIDELAEAALKRYKDAQGEFEGKSAFKEATETLTKKQIIPPQTAQEMLREELIAQNITVENITDMGNESIGGKSR